MKKSFYLPFAAYCLLFIVFLWGCGTGPGQPGSSGCENYGLICDATITPTYLGVNTNNVDALRDVCTVGPPPVYEDFTDHTATVTINVSLMNPTTTVTPPPLFIESYTIEYIAQNDSIGAPPIESDSGFISFSVTPPTGTSISTVSQTLVFVDIPRKTVYWQDMLSGLYSSVVGPPTFTTYEGQLLLVSPGYINNYTAIYTIQGQIQGTSVTMTATAPFSIGDYDYCSGG